LIREGALLLSSLVLSPDGALERYRAQRSGDPKLDLEHLRHARELLDAVAFAITAGEAGRWSRIEQAWRAAREDAGRRPKPRSDKARKPAQAPARASSEQTAEVNVATFATAGAAVPFRGTANPPVPAAQALPRRTGVEVEETAAMSPLRLGAEPLPFGPRSGPELTLEQYASLGAELRARSTPRSAVLVRYGVGDEQGLAALEGRWARRLADDPSLRRRFDELATHYEQWLRDRGRQAKGR
jgi:hypothetical protein